MYSCPSCDSSFKTLSGKRQHHTKVHGEPLNNRECTYCGDSFYDENSSRKRCDDCKELTGELNPNWSGARVSSTCIECGNSFYYYPSNKDGLYCKTCVNDSNIDWGNDNLEPFEGDGSSDYGSTWRKARSRARNRDNYTCQKCGVSEEEYHLNQALDVHHIIPLSEFENTTEAHQLDNLVTLCRKCHHTIETSTDNCTERFK